MLNHTFTSTIPIKTDSYLNESFSAKGQEEPPQAVLEDSIFSISSLSSIEIMRNHVKLALKNYEFETAFDEADFLLRNYDVFKLLPSLGDYLKKYFGFHSKITLELLNEGPQWQTLFINIYTKYDWEKSKKFVDTFLDNMFALYPQVAEKLNVNINPDGV